MIRLTVKINLLVSIHLRSCSITLQKTDASNRQNADLENSNEGVQVFPHLFLPLYSVCAALLMNLFSETQSGLVRV